MFDKKAIKECPVTKNNYIFDAFTRITKTGAWIASSLLLQFNSNTDEELCFDRSRIIRVFLSLIKRNVSHLLLRIELFE